ncbi:nitrogen fixation protein NifZ [Propionivibrio dicarboxylicus]|uniref:Nitrogen fixation protein NifZ n=1 Tax=Propionivibrio dicarboxylicus TaxID=83767 RepID=A0A1G7VDT8_9RHOO|nr:nitrogen fixation protein NifZ [Propionivibrio dicarboxylicus]SDG57728.1 nitrogen fixation protein NifZ [Propionivibrio dicarboxylicus]
MQTRWDIGESVRVVRNLRNDGTFAGTAVGELLIRAGSTGTIVDVGTFLIDQVIYTVHFLDDDRMVGCREEELDDIDAPWLPSRFGSRERVASAQRLKLGAELTIAPGTVGEVLRVLRDGAAPVYHVHFDSHRGRVFAVPESALRALEERLEKRHEIA